MTVAESSQIGSEAEAVIERLRRVAPKRRLDRERAEAALAQYLDALGMEPRPVRWIGADGDRLDAARQGFKTAWETLCRKGRPGLVGSWPTRTFEPLYGKGLRRGGLIGAAEKEEKAAGWGAKRHAHKAEKRAGEQLEGPIREASRHSELATAVEAALGDKGMYRRASMFQAGQTTESIQAAQDSEMHQEIRIGDATEQAANAARWFARAHQVRAAGKSADAMESAARAHLPLVDAVEAGLWLFWVADDVVIAVAR
jgi:hypothetical protein